jgi:N-acetylglucosamine transport system permease protein
LSFNHELEGKHDIMKKIKLSDIIIRVPLVLYSIIVIFPILWTAATSLKTNQEFYMNPWALPAKPQWINYVSAWYKADISKYFGNSLFITIFSILVSILLASTSAYVLARFNFKFNKLITTLYVAGIMVPGILTIIPTFFLLQDLHMYNSLIGLSFVYISRTLPFSMTVLIGFFKTLQREIEEAALIDGCGYFRTFWSIMLPMSKPGIITISIFNFLYYWNEFELALTFLPDKSKSTLTLGMQSLMQVAQYRTDWGALFAGLMLVMVPTIIVYTIFEGHITEGLSAGAVKG